MLFLAAAAALATAPPNPPSTAVRATVQAQAIVRIITGVSVRLGEGALVGEAPRPQTTFARAGGQPQLARLIQFQ